MERGVLDMIPSTYTPKDVYAADGVTFEFAVTFPVDRALDIMVLLHDADGERVHFIRNLDYAIREVSGVYTVVTRVDDHRDPIAAGFTITILRRMLFVQPSGRSSMAPIVFKNRVDSLTRMFQQLREKLDRTLHVGQVYPPFYAVSRPYAVLFSDELSIAASADSGQSMQAIIEELLISAVPTGGDLRVNLVEYNNWPAEELDIAAEAEDGVLALVLLSYVDWPAEEIDIAAEAEDCVLFTALLSYNNWPAEELDIAAEATGGTLS
jgi:hypothetical protein